MWVSCEATIDSFSIHVSKIIVELFGKFILSLESRFTHMSKSTVIDKKTNSAGRDSMKGRYALVWFPVKDPVNGTIIFDDDLGRYLYARCSGQEHDPLGFFFKWFQYDGDSQLDDRLYLDKIWKIVWLPHQLSETQCLKLSSCRYLVEFTGSIT